MKTTGFLFLAAMLATQAGFAQQGASDEIRNVSVTGFKHAMDSLRDEVIVDLRTPEEIGRGKIAGALEIDFFGEGFEPALKTLDKEKVYLLYCAGGGRSGETATLMKEMGFKCVYNLEPGFNGWRRQQMPVEVPKQKEPK